MWFALPCRAERRSAPRLPWISGTSEMARPLVDLSKLDSRATLPVEGAHPIVPRSYPMLDGICHLDPRAIWSATRPLPALVGTAHPRPAVDAGVLMIEGPAQVSSCC
jgi:hypothetical protein